MIKNAVILEFSKTITNLAGYDFGLKIFDEQVFGKIDLNQKYEIIFPSEIKGVASSFVQGFFSKIVDEIGLATTEERTIITASNDKLAASILSKLQ